MTAEDGARGREATTADGTAVAAVELRDVSAWYGDVPALQDISLSITAGETTAILGPNGAGKTSLLRRLSGLSTPRGTGEIFLFGECISGLRPDQIVSRGMVQVPENRQIFASLTVTENLEMGAHIKTSRHHFKERAANACELFPVLASRRKQIAGSLSGGEQQMLAIGRALMSGPRVLLLDEPSLGIAPAVVDELFKSLGKLHAMGLTLVLAEQNAAQALDLAKKAFVLSLGRVGSFGDTEEILRDPEIQQAYFGIDSQPAK